MESSRNMLSETRPNITYRLVPISWFHRKIVVHKVLNSTMHTYARNEMCKIVVKINFTMSSSESTKIAHLENLEL